MSIDPGPEERRDALERATAAVLDHLRTVGDGPVAPPVDPVALRERIAALDLESGNDAPLVIDEVADLLRSATVHVTSPRYLGLFNPTPLTAGIAADVLTAGFNPQLAAWSHAPAAVELEARALRELASWLGLGDDTAGSFTTGGAEANASAVVLALQSAYPAVSDGGLRALPGTPTVYASAESHLAWLKIAQQCGLGRDQVRLVPVDDRLRLDVGRLRDRLAADRAAGALPVLIVATAGTTAAGVVDPLDELADVAAAEEVWLHVDAAWAGAAAASTRLRRHLEGIARADSVTVDAHKWLSVPMGAGTFLTRHPDVLARAFAVSTSYMPPEVEGQAPDPYVTSVQWSRRAAGLKLLVALAVHGRRGYARQLEHDVELAEVLRDLARADGWEVVNDTPLPVVCLRDRARADDGRFHDEVAAAVVRSGEAWVSSVRLAGTPALRACVISHRTTEDDVRRTIAALGAARAAVTGEAPTVQVPAASG